MAKLAIGTVKASFYLFLLAIAFSLANSARILDEVDPENPPLVDPPASVVVPPSTSSALPSGQIPGSAATAAAATIIAPVASPADDDEEADPPIPETEEPAVVPAPAADDETEPDTEVATPTPSTTSAPTAGAATTTSATAAIPASPQTSSTTTTTTGTGTGTGTASPPLSFYMHDISGGSHPSSRVVTGIIARTEINGIPFSVPNNNFFPLQGGTPLLNTNDLNNLINPNTAPLLSGLTGAQSSTVLQNTGNNNNVVSGNQPFVTAGNLPAGITLQKLMFGSITVVDNELTEGHELGSSVLGKAQGFYLASSMDGTSHTLALTVLLHGGDNHGDEVEDTISFFGVHRTATPDSPIAVIGGTGKYEDAQGYATVETIQQDDQHTTDGVDTVMLFTVYLTE